MIAVSFDILSEHSGTHREEPWAAVDLYNVRGGQDKNSMGRRIEGNLHTHRESCGVSVLKLKGRNDPCGVLPVEIWPESHVFDICPDRANILLML